LRANFSASTSPKGLSYYPLPHPIQKRSVAYSLSYKFGHLLFQIKNCKALTQNLRQSIYLAHQIHSGITSNLGIKSRGVKFANFQVLRETIALCPSILVELCFLSNWDEAGYLSENSKLKALAFSILNSLIKTSEL